MHPQAFPSLLWGLAPPSPGYSSYPHLHHPPSLCVLPLLTVPLLCFLAGPPAHQVSLSCICSASQAKFDEGLQHNTHRFYKSEQQMFQSFCSWYHLTAFLALEDTLMVFVTYLDEHLQ